MDKVHFAFELVGIVVMLCGVIAKFLPEGKAKEVFSQAGTLPVKAIQTALEKK